MNAGGSHADMQATLERLHSDLLAGDPTAPAALAEILWPLLLRRLRRLVEECPDKAEAESRIGLCIAHYVADPSRYRSERGSLLAYLTMDAKGDLQTELKRQGKRYAKVLLGDDYIALEEVGEKYVIDENRDDDPEDEGEEGRILLSVVSGLSCQEQAFVDLWKQGARETAPFAAALGISHVPLEDQTRAVTRFKDALKKKIKRRYVRALEEASDA